MNESPRPDEAMEMQGEKDHLAKIIRQLLDYCVGENWSGYDPYDALNSRLLQHLPILNAKVPRLVLTQALKRSPINFRPLLLVPKTQNPKGIALFLSAMAILDKLEFPSARKHMDELGRQLLALRSKGYEHWVWGYSFDWQTRTKLVPKGSPNIICTTFAANALLDAYERTSEATFATAALSAATFVLERLYSEEGNNAWFNYTLHESSQIHNANLLGAALLARVARLLDQNRFLAPALRATRFSTERQNADGSWYYGERRSPSQLWIDNFHTGFNLCALQDISTYSDTRELNGPLTSGLDYYKRTFFRGDGAARYFHNRTYPVDIHSVAQAIITLVKLSGFAPESTALVDSTLTWALANMRDRQGFFYYQKQAFFLNRIPYIRWSEAWMLLALSMLLRHRTPVHVFHSAETIAHNAHAPFA